MKRNNKKGFTIVELTIVIAVIAILAAVLIPTFSSVVDKANQSADVQLVRQANVVLQAATADGSSLSEKDAIEELKNNSIKLDKPSQSDCVFYYLESENRYVIFDTKEKKMTYPEDMVEKYKDKEVSSWLKYDFTLDFKVSRTFTTDKVKESDNREFQQYVDTGVKIDWTKDFTITETFVYDSEKQPQMPFGNWTDGNGTGFNIELYNNSEVQVWIHGSKRACGKPINTGEYDLTFKWNASNKTFTFTLKKDGKPEVNYGNVYCGDLNGIETNTLRLGAADHRPAYYKDIEVKSFQITYTVGYGKELDLPEVKSNITDYRYKGWFKAATGGDPLGNEYTMPAADTTIYAQWPKGTNE